jgi:hypothetical protein
MSSKRLATVLLPLVGLFVVPCMLAAGQVQTDPVKNSTAKGKLSADEMSARIDRHIGARWRKEGVKPAALCDDATFFRRVHLDLIGKIPTILDIRDFLDDDRADKRKIWVEKLLATEAHSDHFANVYRAMILTQAETEQTVFLIGGFENWLRKKFKEGAGYDKLVHELLTSPVQIQPNFGPDGNNLNNPSPAAFFAANEFKAENLAGATASTFLGVKIECAQCHKHPFADWTKTQFWEFAAFFSRTSPNGNFAPEAVEVDDNGEVKQPVPKVQPLEPTILIPKTDERVKAKFLDGRSPQWKQGMDPRKVLADWITSPDNPYFSRIAVNQMWHYFFGVGLVDPVDDLGKHNPASHPELLNELADQFVKNGYDLKYLMRTIVNSKAYQLSSAAPAAPKKEDDEPENLRLFARMPLRALTGEQLFDSLAEVMEYKVDRTRQAFPGLGLTPREEFLSKFANPENKRVDTHTSILQALHLMNGKFMANVTNVEKNKTLLTIAQSDAETSKRIETLYLVALSRMPTAAESDRLTKYVNSGGPTGDQSRALADVFWALLNSAEFSLNH